MQVKQILAWLSEVRNTTCFTGAVSGFIIVLMNKSVIINPEGKSSKYGTDAI